MDYFAITAKCGHAGTGKFTERTYYVSGPDLITAADLVRSFPGVKHDLPTAILKARKISKKEYEEGRRSFREKDVIPHNSKRRHQLRNREQNLKSIFSTTIKNIEPEPIA